MNARARSGLLPALLVCLAAIAGCLLLGRFDNKYNLALPCAQEGVCVLDRAALENGRPRFLVDGWELYPGKLLTPREIAAGGETPVPAYIGEYPNFSFGKPDASPLGEATYRIRLMNDGPPVPLLLELPEIFSAASVWIDGRPALRLGDPRPGHYQPRVATTYLSFTAAGCTELVIAAANHTHYYSGVYYPPAVGTAAAVGRMALLRAAFYGALCFSSLSLALFSLSIWLAGRRQNRLHFLYGLLCAAFALHVCYPFLHWAGLPFARLPYLLEDVSLLAVVLLAAAVTARLCGLTQTCAYRRAVLPGCLAACPLAALCNLLLPFCPAWFLELYGGGLSLFKLAVSGWLLASSLRGVRRELPFGRWLLCGNAAFAIGLSANVLGSNRFEPAYTGWQDEYAAFVLVLLFGAMMVRRNLAILAENRYLAANLADEVAKKTRELSGLLSERKKFLSDVAHDLKAPMTSIQNYIELIEEDGVNLDRESKAFLEAIDRKFYEMKNRVNLLQEFTAQDEAPLNLAPLPLEELLAQFYESNLPDLEASGVNFLLALPGRPCPVLADRDRLGRVLENLCYNALSFTPEDGTITLSLEMDADKAVVRVEDTGCGIPPEELPHVFDRFYSRREDGGGSGLGLYIVKSTIQEHGGRVRAASEPGRGSVFTFTLPLHKNRPQR